MKRAVILLAFGLAFVLSVNAQQIGNDVPASKEDVERYLEVAHSSTMLRQMAQAMSKPMHDMVHQEFIKDQGKLPPDWEGRMDQTMDDMLSSMPWDEMLQSMVPVYEKHFTHGDIEALTAFYSTPVGQKILREMPAISAEAMQSMMPIMQKQIAAMRERVQQEVAESLKSTQK